MQALADSAHGAAETFRATVKPHPLRGELVDGRVPVGCSLADMGAGGAVLAFVDGERADELGYAPQADQHVVLIATAEGGGGKDPLRLAATLALAFAAPGIGGAAAGAAGFGSAAGWGLAVNLAGNLAINALIPPSTQALDRFDPLKPFEGLPNASNALQPFGVIPRLYGTHRVFPPQASRPFSESEGSDQYLRMLLCLGYGPLEIDDLAPGLHRAPDEGGTSTVPNTVRIGETALNEYTDWELEWLPGGDSDPPLTLFTRNVIEVAPEAPVFDDEGITATRTAASGKTISVDLAAPAIVQLGRQAYPCAVGIRIEVRATGTSGAWLEVTPPEAAAPGDVPGRISGDWRQAYSGNYPAVDGVTGTTGGNVLFPAFDTLPAAGLRERAWFLKGSDVKPVSLSVQIDLPTDAAYDVRITRLKTWSVLDPRFGPVSPREPFQADFAWRALRTIGADIAQTVPPGLAFLALRIRTTDQLNGVVNNLSVVAGALLPVWNGSTWVMQRTSNPAWIYRDVLTGAATGRPLDAARVDDDALIDWAARNTADDREFNGIFDGRTTVYEAARNVASVGRAAFSIRDGLFSVVEDMPDKVPRQLFTPRNCWDFGATKTFSRPLHALKVKFKNRDADWQDSERIVYADGYSEDGSGGTEVATEFESLALFGLTDKQQAFVEGRYFQAVAVLRPETATWMADIENLVCRRGDVVRYQHDALLLGLGAGRIKAIVGGSITLDESLRVQLGKNYQARIRKADGTQALATITNEVGTYNTLDLSGGVPAGVAVGDLVAFGETGLVTQDWLITGIEPQADFQARITAVPYSSPQVFSTGPIPPYDPLVTRAETRPPEPVIVSVLSGSGAGLRANNGGRTSRILVSYVFPSSSVAVPQVEAALLRDGDRSWEMRPSQPNSGLYTFVVVDAAADYRVRIRGVADDGTPGPWAEAVALNNQTGGEPGDITLVEQINTPSTPEGDLSTVVATVEPPDPEDPAADRYSHSVVDYRRVADVAWQDGGLTDPNGQARIVLVADGATYEFRARGVSVDGVVDVDGPTETITLTDAAVPVPDPDADATPDAALNVANLRIVGFAPAVDEFDGADAPFEWDAVTDAQDYRVRIFSVGGSPVQLRLQYVRGPRFTYTYAQNVLDAAAAGLAGPQREFLIEVMARSRDGRISATPAEKQAINPPPVLPGDFTATVFFSAIEMQYGTPDDGDYAGVRVHLTTTEGFTPAPENVVYDGGTEMPIVVQGLDAGTTYYYRLVLRDLFGPGPASAEFEATTQGLPWEDNVPPTVPEGLTLRSEVQESDLYTSAALIAEWEAATDNSGKLFYEIEYWTDDAEVAADTRSGNEEEAFVLAMFDGADTVAVGLEEDAVAGGIFRDATVETSYTVFPARVGATYQFRLRAVDYSGNRSGWLGPLEHTIEGDTVPPAVPTELIVSGGLDKVVVRWINPPDADWIQTRVHRGLTAGFTAGPENLIAETRGDTHVDTPLVPGTDYWYRLVALDVSGNASAASDAVGPVQPILISPVNIDDFLAPDTLDPSKFTQGFRDLVGEIEDDIGGLLAEVGVIQAELSEILLTPDFDTGNDYLIGDAVVFDGKLYRAIDDQTAPSVAPPDTDFWQLIGDFSSLAAAVAANSAAISLLETEAIDLDGRITTNATAITGLISDITGIEDGIEAQATAISLLETEVTSQDGRITTNSNAITALSANVGDLETEQAAQATAISALQTEVIEQDGRIEANANDLTALFADLTAPFFALGADDGAVLALSDEGGEAVAAGVRQATASAIEDLRVTVSLQGDLLTSTSSQVTALESEIVVLDGVIAGNSTAISGLTTTVTQQGLDITSNSEAITAVEASITTLEGGVSGNASAISGLSATVTSQGGQITANANAITSINTTLGDNSASITSLLSSVDGIEAQFSIRANVNGRVTGIGLIAGGASTTFGVLADRFVVVDPSDNSTVQAPFEIVGGSVYIKSAFIRNLDAIVLTSGTIDADRIGARSIAVDKLEVLEELSSLSANLGTVTAGFLIGATFVTTETGARVQIDKFNGIRTVNSSNVTTAQLSLNGAGFLGVGGNAISWNTAGVVTIPGTLLAGDIVGNTFRTATSGWRVEVGPSLTGSTVLRYTNGTDTRLSLSQTGNLNLTGAITGSTITGTTITGGFVRTSSSGSRVELGSTFNDLRVFNGDSDIRVTLGGFSGGSNAWGVFGSTAIGESNIGLIALSRSATAFFADSTLGTAIVATGETGAELTGDVIDLELSGLHSASGGHVLFNAAGSSSFGRPTWNAPGGTLVARREVSGGQIRLWLQQAPGNTNSWVGLSTF